MWGKGIKGPRLDLHQLTQSTQRKTDKREKGTSDSRYELYNVTLCLSLQVKGGSDGRQGDQVTSRFRSLFDEEHAERACTQQARVHVPLRDVQCQHKKL